MPEVARIGAEVLVWPELSGVDENANHGDVLLRPAGRDQREMAIVKTAHRRDEPDAILGQTILCQSAPKLSDRRDCLHGCTLHHVARGFEGVQVATWTPTSSGSR